MATLTFTSSPQAHEGLALSYSDFASPTAVSLPTANTPVAITTANVDEIRGQGEYDDVTGVFTVREGGHFKVDASVVMHTDVAAGTVSFQVAVNDLAHRNLKTTRIEATAATITRHSFSGVTDYLSPGVTITPQFVSDQNSDAANVREFSFVIQNMADEPGTAV